MLLDRSGVPAWLTPGSAHGGKLHGDAEMEL